MNEELQQAKILIVDNEVANLRYLELILRRANYHNLLTVSDPRAVPGLYDAFQPDLLILDWHMPGWCGADVLDALHSRWTDDGCFPVLVITADSSTEARQQALARGAKAFVTRPFNRAELLLHIQVLLDTRRLYRSLKRQAQALLVEYQRLQHGRSRPKGTRALSDTYDTLVESWSCALVMRDKETAGHSSRVAQMTVRLGRAMGMDEVALVHLRRGALLHDIGKLGVPDQLLLKNGPLSDTEWTVMRQHPVYAYDLLAPFDFLHPALDIPLYHHERWNGTGYPFRLRGHEIPLAARIFAVVDVWDALRSDRPYRRGWSDKKVRAYLANQTGQEFDPEVVTNFLRLLDLEPSYSEVPLFLTSGDSCSA